VRKNRLTVSPNTYLSFLAGIILFSNLKVVFLDFSEPNQDSAYPQ
jgi:hypothetical protein